MDTSILQLFTADEIMSKLARLQSTGCFKIFTAIESANVFFKKGMIVAAVKGEAQGETALRQIIDWKDTLFIWEPDIVAPIPPLKPVLIKVESFLAKQNLTKTTSTGISPPLGSKTVGVTRQGSGANGRTATKSITATGEDRTAQDEALLSKHKLILVAVADSAQRFKIGQVNSLIGRNPGCDITIPDVSISRQHCLLQLTDRGLHVKDLNTVNGTKINGIAMKEGYINVGDKLTVGYLAFALELAEE